MRTLVALATAALTAASLGCSTPSGQLSQCQSEKEQLLATIREQRDANRQMHERVASLESRLDESEKELARLDKPGIRMSSTKASNPVGPRGAAAGSSAFRGVPGATNGPRAAPRPDTSLAWKSPTSANSTTSKSSSLTSLAAKDNRVALDRDAGIARLNAPIAFADNSAALSAEAKRQLDDVAKLLKSKDATDLKVLVSGFAEGRPPKSGENAFGSARELAAARAQAVADYLDRHGIAEERLAVTGAGSRLAADAAAGQPAASGVEILLAERDAPVIGWGGTSATIRR